MVEAHGTFVGTIRIDAEQPQHLMVDQSFHFGASTRRYVLREKPAGPSFPKGTADFQKAEAAKLLGLPESEEEMDVI